MLTEDRGKTEASSGRVLNKDGSTINTWLQLVLKFLFGYWLLLASASLFMISLSTDEGQILLGFRSVLEPLVPHLSGETVLTSGGTFAFANIAIEWLFGSQVWIHKLLSLFCLLTVLILLWQTGTQEGGSSTAGWLVLAPLLGLPGTIEICTLTIGHSMAFMLLFLAYRVWISTQYQPLVQVVLTGSLLGLAASCRFEFLVVIPVLLLDGMTNADNTHKFSLKFPWRAMAATLVILGTLAASVWLLMQVGHPDLFRDSMNKLGPATGLRGGTSPWWLPTPRQLNTIVVGIGFFPPFLAVVVTALPFVFLGEKPNELRFANLMSATGWILFAAWVLQSPLALLRYVWPALACFAIPGGLVLRRLYSEDRDRAATGVRSIILLMSVALVGGGVAQTTRSVILGDADLWSWESARLMRLELSRGFQSNRNQIETTRFIHEKLPANATVIGYHPFFLRYLTHRPIVNIHDLIENPELAAELRKRDKIYLVLTPIIGNWDFLLPETDRWIEKNAVLLAQFGRYSIYELPAGLPSEVAFLRPFKNGWVRNPLSEPYFRTDPADYKPIIPQD